jgi:hypothetical protein
MGAKFPPLLFCDVDKGLFRLFSAVMLLEAVVNSAANKVDDFSILHVAE